MKWVSGKIEEEGGVAERSNEWDCLAEKAMGKLGSIVCHPLYSGYFLGQQN